MYRTRTFPPTTLLVLLITLGPAVLAGCDLVTGEDTVTVRGTVTDARTGQPLSGVQVDLEVGGSFGSTPDRLDSDRTSSDGSYEVKTVTDDCLALFGGFYVGAYRGDYGYRSASAECESGTQTVDIEMVPRDP